MRHISRAGHRQPIEITDPETGRTYLVPQGGDEDDGEGEGGEGEGSGEGSGDGEGEGSGDGEGEGSGEGEGAEGEGEPETFTKEQVEDLIKKRLGTEQTKHKRALKAAQRKAADPKEGEGTDEKVTIATARAVKAEARAAAIAAGVPKDRAARFVGLADLTDIDALLDGDGDIDDDAIEALVEETLEEWPEFKPSPEGKGKSGASGGEGHKGEAKKTKVWTRAEIAELDDKEYEANREDIQSQIRKGLVR